MIRIAKGAQAIRPTLIRQVTDRAKPTSISLGLGQPDLEISEGAETFARAHLEAGTAPYTPNLGLAGARKAVGDHYGISAENVMLTCGVQEAMAVAILGLADPGDMVLVPDPGFPAYENLVRLAGATPKPYRLDPATWQPDLSTLTPELKNARAIVINTPSNPTGVSIKSEIFEQLISSCEENGTTWISDEIYEDIVFDGRHRSAREFAENGVVLSGLSKSHCLMGWRIGWLTGPAETVEALKPLHQHLVTSAPVFSQHALIGALQDHDRQVEAMLTEFRARREVMCEGLANIPRTTFVQPDGAFYVFLNVEAYVETTTLDLAIEILDSCDVVTIPGEGFGDAGAGHLRLAFTRPIDELQEAIGRLQRFFESR